MQTPLSKIRHHKKRHFQLLELMVAAFILLICIAPTMRIFTSIYQSQQAIIRENQRDHLAHLVHAKFTEQLYKRTIRLPEAEQTHPIILSDPDIAKLLQQFAYNCSGEFTIIDTKGQEKSKQYLSKFVIKMEDKLYKAPKRVGKKEIENQDPSLTFYDYDIFIDSKKIAGNSDQGTQNPTQVQNEEEETPETDDDNDDESDEEDDQVVAQKKHMPQPHSLLKKGSKPLNGKPG